MSLEQVTVLLDLFGNRHGDYLHDESKSIPLPYYIHTIDLMTHRGLKRVDIADYNKQHPLSPYINIRESVGWNINDRERGRIKNVFDFISNCIDSYVVMYTKDAPPNKEDKFTFGGIRFHITIKGLYRNDIKILDLDYSDREVFKRYVTRIFEYVAELIKPNIMLRGIGCVIPNPLIDDYIGYVNSVITA